MSYDSAAAHLKYRAEHPLTPRYCPGCGAVFTPARNDSQRWCTPSCREKDVWRNGRTRKARREAYLKTKPAKCASCSAPIRGDGKTGLCQPCARPERCTCAECGAETPNRGRKLCTSCYEGWLEKPLFERLHLTERICAACGTTYQPRAFKQVYCSTDCSRRNSAQRARDEYHADVEVGRARSARRYWSDPAKYRAKREEWRQRNLERDLREKWEYATRKSLGFEPSPELWALLRGRLALWRKVYGSEAPVNRCAVCQAEIRKTRVLCPSPDCGREWARRAARERQRANVA